MTWQVEPLRHIDTPQPGFWMVRLVKGGPEVPAAIQWELTRHEPGNPTNRMERSPILTARIQGEIVPVEMVWLRRGRPITEAEFRFQIADTEWAKTYAPAEPKANPKAPIDLLQAPLPF